MHQSFVSTAPPHPRRGCGEKSRDYFLDVPALRGNCGGFVFAPKITLHLTLYILQYVVVMIIMPSIKHVISTCYFVQNTAIEHPEC